MIASSEERYLEELVALAHVGLRTHSIPDHLDVDYTTPDRCVVLIRGKVNHAVIATAGLQVTSGGFVIATSREGNRIMRALREGAEDARELVARGSLQGWATDAKIEFGMKDQADDWYALDPTVSFNCPGLGLTIFKAYTDRPSAPYAFHWQEPKKGDRVRVNEIVTDYTDFTVREEATRMARGGVEVTMGGGAVKARKTRLRRNDTFKGGVVIGGEGVVGMVDYFDSFKKKRVIVIPASNMQQCLYEAAVVMSENAPFEKRTVPTPSSSSEQ